MKTKLLVSHLVLLHIFIVAGCSGEGVSGEIIPRHNSTEEERIAAKNISEKPPVLSLSIGENTIKKQPVAYGWSYYDTTEDAMVTLEAEALPPASLVDTSNGEKDVSSHTNILLNFEEPPMDYKVRVWNPGNNVIATYDEIDLSKHAGVTIYEIRANWEQGNAGYFFSVNIQE